MLGLRTKEDPKFNIFFEILQNNAKNQGIVFFSQAGDGRNIETEDFEGEDMMGWLIPLDRADEFEKEFMKVPHAQSFGAWDDFFGFANWKFENGELTFDFE